MLRGCSTLAMSGNKNYWPKGMYSRETWADKRDFTCRTLHSCPSAPLFANDFSEKRKCLYGKRSFSTSPNERSEMDNEKVLKVLSQERSDSSEDGESDYTSAWEIEKLKQDKFTVEEKRCVTRSSSNTSRMSDAIDDRDSLQESRISFGLGDKNTSCSDHMYENICNYNEVSESSTSCSTGKNSVYSSDSLPIESFENCEYMTSEAVSVKSDHSSDTKCAYAIPRCNCVLQQQSILTNNNTLSDINKIAVTQETNLCTKLDVDNRLSNAYICMDSYIHMNTIPQCRKKEKIHDYENNKDWVKQDESLGEMKLAPGENRTCDASPQKVATDSGVVDMYVFPQLNKEKTCDYENNREWINQDQGKEEMNPDPAVDISLDTSPEQPTSEQTTVDTILVDKCPNKEKPHDYENEKEWLKPDTSRQATIPEPPSIKLLDTAQKQIITESRDVNVNVVKEPDSKVNPIPTPIKKEVREKEDVDVAIKSQLSRQSSQSFRRHGRRQDRKRLDHSLLEATLAQQEGGYIPDAEVDYDLPVLGELVGAEQQLEEPADSKLDNTELSEQAVYLPNIHPKLIHFLKSSTAHRHHLEEEMNLKDMTIVWPATEDGILKLQPKSKRKWCPCSSELNTEEELSNIFQKYLRSFAVDDSICSAKEIFDDLSALQQQVPLVSKCTIHNERMNFTLVGDKKSVVECKEQLLALINFLELRLKASKVYSTTKTKYLARHEIRMVFESKLLDKYQKKHDQIQVEVCDKFEYVRFTGDMQTVDSAMMELHGYLKRINGQVYKCSNLVRRLLNKPQTKSLLQQLLRNHSLACAWIATDDICIVYGTSAEDIQFVKDIFKKFLVTETILFSQGQKGILQSKLGIVEVHTIMKLNDGYLELETSDISVEIACVQRIQDDVSKRIKKYLQKHEVIKTVQELDSGMFQFMQRFCQDRVSNLKDHCKNILVELTAFEEKLKCGYVLTGKRDFCKIALRDLEKVLASATSFEHTLKRIGLVQFLQSEAGRAQVSALESEHRCVLHYSDGSPICQSKICACQYKGKEIVVLQEDISSVSSGLAYIPCTPSCEEMKHNIEVEMPRKLVVRECMVSPDAKYTNKSNFFACLPDIKSWSLEARDALRASVELSMQEVKKRGITTIAFSSCVTDFPSKEYAKILVETVKTLLDGERHPTKLKTMMFCAKDAGHTSSFVQTLKQSFGCKTVQVSGSIRETKTVLNASNLINDTESTVYATVKEANSSRNEKDHKPPIAVNIVQENAGSIKADAIFIPTNENFDLPRSSSQLLNSNIAERIHQQFHAAFPFGIAVGQVVSLKAEDLMWDVVYIANIGAAGKEVNRKELEVVVRKVLDKCGEDEIESLAFMAPDIGIYLLSEVLFNAIQPFIMRNCMLERVDIVVQPQDRSSYLPFEAMKKQFHERAVQFGSNESLYSSAAQISAEEKKGSVSFTEGCVNVELTVGDITKETTDAIVNSVQGNLDLSIGRIAKAVSEAAGDVVQTEIKTKQNLSKIRRDGFVVSGPGKLPCRYIFHIKIRGSIDGWKSIISVCLQQAESLGITSLSFPALGTGRKGIKPRYFSKIILKCIRRFAESHPRCLRHVRIVVLEDSMFQTIVQAANAFKCKKKRHTLRDKIHDMLKKESPKQPEDEVVLQVYTDVENVENVTKQLNELCLQVSLEPVRRQETGTMTKKSIKEEKGKENAYKVT